MFTDVIKEVCKGVRVEEPSAATLAFLKKHRVPETIVDLLKACSVSAIPRVGHLRVCPFADLPELNGKPNQHALKNGFLVMGSGLNGDPIAVELSTGEVAFLSHELLWGLDPDVTGFDECVARSTLDIDTFWARALADKELPVDFSSTGGGE